VDAREYNASQVGTLWTVEALPWWLRSFAPDSLRFANEVRRWQAAHGLKDDGKLGPGTWSAVKAAEGYRPAGAVAGPEFGPVHLANVEIVPSAREERKRSVPVSGVGIHTTGAGIFASAQNHGWTGEAGLERVLRNLLSAPSSYVSHAYVLPSGRTLLTVPADECAVHGAISPYRDLYAKGFDSWRWYRGTTPNDLRKHTQEHRYDAWKALADRYGWKSPFDVCADPNNLLWAFDLVPVVQDGQETFSASQFQRCAELVAWAGETFGLALSERTVLEHRWWSPITRWPWDPGANFSRKRVGALLRGLPGHERDYLGDDDVEA
jgi:hypothetical protein